MRHAPGMRRAIHGLHHRQSGKNSDRNGQQLRKATASQGKRHYPLFRPPTAQLSSRRSELRPRLSTVHETARLPRRPASLPPLPYRHPPERHPGIASILKDSVSHPIPRNITHLKDSATEWTFPYGILRTCLAKRLASSRISTTTTTEAA